MSTHLKRLIFVLTALAVFVTGMIVSAQETDANRNFYYIAADEKGVMQIFHQIVGGDGTVRQVTHTEINVVDFAVAHDGLSLAYISDWQLWLQPIHTDEAEALATLEAVNVISGPVFSEDDAFIAYADNGVWLYDLAARETTQVLADVPLAADASNVPEARTYLPTAVVTDAEGNQWIVLSIVMWEWMTAGTLNVATGEVSEVERDIHINALALDNGSLLLYGNSGLGGHVALHVAPDFADVNAYTELANPAELHDDAMFVDQATEIEPGIVRMTGLLLDLDTQSQGGFTVDVNTETGEMTNFSRLVLAEDLSTAIVLGELSPDGHVLPFYADAMWTERNTQEGIVTLLDTATGEPIAIDLPEAVGPVHWQP